MARPREFDEAAVLDAAIERFWQRGYEATSVRDLADEMNIAGASLYNTFGDKRGLYARALSRYLDETFRERIRRIEPAISPREAIGVFLQEIVKRSLTDKRRRGCMLVNSAIESAPFDPNFLSIVATFLDEVEAFFFRCVSKGQKEGSITRDHSAQDLSNRSWESSSVSEFSLAFGPNGSSLKGSSGRSSVCLMVRPRRGLAAYGKLALIDGDSSLSRLFIPMYIIASVIDGSESQTRKW